MATKCVRDGGIWISPYTTDHGNKVTGHCRISVRSVLDETKKSTKQLKRILMESSANLVELERKINSRPSVIDLRKQIEQVLQMTIPPSDTISVNLKELLQDHLTNLKEVHSSVQNSDHSEIKGSLGQIEAQIKTIAEFMQKIQPLFEKTDHSATEIKLDTVQHQLDQAKSNSNQYDEMFRKNQELNNQLSMATSDLASLKTKLDAYVPISKLTDLEKEKTELQKQMSELQLQLEKELSERPTSKQDLVDLKEKNQALDSQLQAVQTQLQTVQSQSSSLTTSKQQLESQLETVQSQLSTSKQQLETQLQTVQSQLSTSKQQLESQLESTSTGLADVTKKLADQVTAFSNLQATYNADQTRFTSEKISLENQLQELRTQLEQLPVLTKERDDLRNQLARSTSDQQSVLQLQSELDAKNLEITRLQEVETELQRKEEELRAVKTQFDSITNDQKDSVAHIQRLTDQHNETVRKLHSEIEVLDKSLRKLESTNGDSVQKNEELTRINRELQSKIEVAELAKANFEQLNATMDSAQQSSRTTISELEARERELQTHL